MFDQIQQFAYYYLLNQTFHFAFIEYDEILHMFKLCLVTVLLRFFFQLNYNWSISNFF